MGAALLCVGGFVMVITLLLLVVTFSRWNAEGFASPVEKKSAIVEFFKKCGKDCKYTDYREQISPDVVEYLEHNRKHRNGKL